MEQCAEHVSHRHAENGGKQERKVPGQFHHHHDSRNGRFDDGCKKGRHTNHNQNIRIGSRHPDEHTQDGEQRAQSRTDRKHGNEDPARNPRAEIEHRQNQFEHDDDEQRRPNRRGKYALDHGKRIDRVPFFVQTAERRNKIVTAAHDVYGNERERAADQKGNQKLSHPLPEPDFCKQFFGKEQQEIKSDRSERTDQRRRKNVNVKQIVGIRGGIEDKSRKACARSDADARTEQVARQNGKDNGRKRTYEYFGRKTFMRLFKRKRHPGKRRVKGDRKTGARAARHRITAHGRVALQHVAHAAAAGAADHDTRAFAACGKSHEYGE